MANRRPGKHLPWRRDPAVWARLPAVERLHWQGQPNTTIAAALGVSENTIRRDLARLAELWHERTAATQAHWRARLVAELEDTERLALAAYDFDLQAERAVLFGEAVPGPDGQPRRVYRDAKGAARFHGSKAHALSVRRQAVMDKAKVLGLLGERVAPTDAGARTLDLTGLAAAAKAHRAERERGKNQIA
jgi:hypothetical protein